MQCFEPSDKLISCILLTVNACSFHLPNVKAVRKEMNRKVGAKLKLYLMARILYVLSSEAIFLPLT